LLNIGLAHADCRYLMRHDADDVCLPQRMAITLAAFAADPSLIAVGGQAAVIDAEGAPLGTMDLPVGARRVAASCFFRNPVAHPAATLAFDAVRRLGIGYGIDFLHALPLERRLLVDGLAEDYYLFGQLALQGRATNVRETLIRYRWHGGNEGATKHRAQMVLSLEISRFLADSFSARHGLPRFDPAPFCHFGDALLDVDGTVDFGAQFDAMAAILRRGFGPSRDLERELAFRRVIATRREGPLLWRYLRFRARHRADTAEYRTVRSWLTRRLRGRASISVVSSA
jgi:hypothetical protein